MYIREVYTRHTSSIVNVGYPYRVQVTNPEGPTAIQDRDYG